MKIGRNLSNSLSRSEIIKRANKSFGTSSGAVVGRRFRPLIGFVLCSIGLLLAAVGWSKSATGTSTTATAQAPWIKLAPTGGPPSPRNWLVAVYDPATNRMTIHGGGNGTNTLNDAWVLTNADGTESISPTWTKLLPANPLSRIAHSAVYDSSSNRMVVFGGTVFGPPLNDVWVLTNANGTEPMPPSWIQLFPTGTPPPARTVHSAVYDANDNRMIVFGGGNQCDSGCIQIEKVDSGSETNSAVGSDPVWSLGKDWVATALQ